MLEEIRGKKDEVTDDLYPADVSEESLKEEISEPKEKEAEIGETIKG